MLSAEQIYLDRTKDAPRLSLDKEVEYFQKQEQYHYHLIETLCKDGDGLYCLRTIVEQNLAEDEEKQVEFKSLEERLRERGGKNSINFHDVFAFCYSQYSITRRGIQRAMQSRLKKEKTTHSFKEARQALYNIKSEEKEFFNSESGLVRFWAAKYQWSDTSFMDRIQEGNLGILTAMDRYDYHCGYTFSNYAGWWIRHYIQKSIPNQGGGPTPSAKILRRVDTLLACQTRLIMQLGRDPTCAELALEAKANPTHVQKYLLWNNQPKNRFFSLDADENEEGSLLNRLPDLTTSPDCHLLINDINKLARLLTPIEQKVLKLRFQDELTLRQTGEIIGKSFEWARRVEQTALTHLSKQCTIIRD